MPFLGKKKVDFVSFPKIIREMHLFWYLIFSKLSLKKKKKILKPYSSVLKSL